MSTPATSSSTYSLIMLVSGVAFGRWVRNRNIAPGSGRKNHSFPLLSARNAMGRAAEPT
jgi:hypothetical protein